MLQIQPTKTMTVRVYDPAMCCSTGVCGPSVDTQLVQFAADLQWLETQQVRVQRYNLSQQPDAFLQNKKVAGLLQAFDEKALPIILVNDEILVYGQYPSREELAQALADAKERSQVKPQAPSTSSCCGPDSNCC
ncbi:arsenic resistance operon repressor [Ktedonobacteria bacterium brp13]|nr:arsenic resistance operon repressor [Ktedonobacteria bacterium brp13]